MHFCDISKNTSKTPIWRRKIIIVEQRRSAGFEVQLSKSRGPHSSYKPIWLNWNRSSLYKMESNIKGIVGMIIPPPEMRAVIDRTAEFVSKQGPEMEKKIYSSDPTHIRFAFIAKDNPFHPYYTFAIQCYKEGRSRWSCQRILISSSRNSQVYYKNARRRGV